MRRASGRRKASRRPSRRRTSGRFFRSLRIALPLIFAGGLFLFFVANDRFLIERVTVVGAQTVSQDGVANLARARLEGRYLFVVPKSHILFYPRSSILRTVLDEYSPVGDVRMSLDGPRTLKLLIVEREAAYVWCPETRRESGKDTRKCYMTDAEGIAFRDASSAPRSAYVTLSGTWVPVSSSANPAGSLVLNPRDLGAVNAFKDFLSKEGVTLDEVSLSPEGDYTFRARGGGEMYLARDQSTARVTENLLAALTAEQFLPYRGKLREVLPKLEYLDLRFDKKIFYTWKK